MVWGVKRADPDQSTCGTNTCICVRSYCKLLFCDALCFAWQQTLGPSTAKSSQRQPTQSTTLLLSEAINGSMDPSSQSRWPTKAPVRALLQAEQGKPRSETSSSPAASALLLLSRSRSPASSSSAFNFQPTTTDAQLRGERAAKRHGLPFPSHSFRPPPRTNPRPTTPIDRSAQSNNHLIEQAIDRVDQ